jgi:hypothetical protein
MVTGLLQNLFTEVRVQITLQDIPVNPWFVVTNWQTFSGTQTEQGQSDGFYT